MEFAHPLVLLLLSPLFLAGWYAIRKGVPKPLIISRMIIMGLLIAALASPFALEMSTVRDDAPRITVISDQTMSMDLFDTENGQKVFEAIKSKTPTTFRQFAGMNSPIGDEVIASGEGDNNIVLVTDGNNNYGKDLFDAISFVSKTGTKVFAVRQDNIHNDASVEIASPKNLIIGNENVFNIVVRQAGSETGYRLDVQIDGTSVMSEEFTQNERMKTHAVSHTFNTLGTHTITAKITPDGEDRFNLNNVFYKSVFVVPKPKVLVLASDTGSPLYEISSSLYDVSTTASMPDDMGVYKVVIADNRAVGQLSADAIRNYVGNGGGFVVVGGDSAYDKGDYNNSPVEAMLPIISRAAEYKGGKNIVLVLDASGSTVGGDPTTGLTFIGLIDANALSVIEFIGRDSSVGVVAFGGETANTDILPLNSQVNKAKLEQFIKDIGPKGGDNPTDLDNGLRSAEKLLNSVSGTKEIIVISDGRMPSKGEGFELIKDTVVDLMNKEINIHFTQILTSYETDPKANPLYEELAKVSTGGKVNVLTPADKICDEDFCLEEEVKPDTVPTPTPTPEITYEYPLIAVNTEHFITKFVNITASITGYNDVTPKLGSERLVSTTRG
ncbi:MAG: VWA domain-containing protein, partial [Candidatus Methanoperedens sp.]